MKLTADYKVICLEYGGKRCERFDSGNPLWFIPNASKSREMMLDGIGVYDLEDGTIVNAIVYEILVTGSKNGKRFSHTTKFRHDFESDVWIDVEESPARLMCDETLFKMYDATIVLSDIKDISGECSQFVA